ncbi:hypothetical protein [Saccharopolyspora cebuensis]|uniref:Uncharacterized protein n=1 Tax=Saccharopolyspora cebuensis TaxID=418759 RepID=A0ABV4CLB8_9PSEU
MVEQQNGRARRDLEPEVEEDAQVRHQPGGLGGEETEAERQVADQPEHDAVREQDELDAPIGPEIGGEADEGRTGPPDE